MGDSELLVEDCCVALCIDAVEENSWDCSSPLISVSVALCFHFVESDWNCFDFRTRYSLLVGRATASLPS